MSRLVLDRLSAGYDGMRVLEGVSMEVAAGSVVLLTGPNGAGKSTLLRAIVGTAQISSGSIHLDGVDLAGAAAHERFRSGIGWVPEGRGLFPGLTVSENLRVAARAWGLRGASVTDSVRTVCERFPLVGSRLDQLAGTLSGGQQQTVAIARAFLVEDLRLLLLDEPSTGLAPIAWEEVLVTCRAVAEDGVAVLVVEQRLRGALAAVDRLAVLVEGRLVRDGAAADAALVEDTVTAEYFSTGAPG